MLNIKRLDKVRNVNILETVKQPPLSQTLQGRQLRHLGDALRKDQSYLISKYAILPTTAWEKKARTA